jgi:hypothetical protein
MAKVTQPLGSVEARGKVAGLVYNTWRGISYVKAKATPKAQGTPRRLAIRALAKQCTLRWQEMADADRVGWNEYAVDHPDIHWTGNSSRLSGYNWFVRTNVRLLDIGLSVVDTAPARPNGWPVVEVSGSVVGDVVTLEWALPAGAPESELIVDVWRTCAQSAGRKPKIEDAKHLAYVSAEAHSYEGGPVARGSYGFFVRTIDEMSGLSSPWALCEVTVSAGAAEVAGPNGGSSSVNLGTRPDAWSDPGEILALDGTSAWVVCADGVRSDDLFVSGFGFGIPETATITGLKFELFAYGDDVGLEWFQLRDDTGWLGDVKNVELPQGDFFWLEYGGSDELWGVELTPAMVNDSGFGMAISNTRPEGGELGVQADFARMTIYYTT